MKEWFHEIYAQWQLDPQWQALFSWAAAMVSILVVSYVLGWLIRSVIGRGIRRVASKTENRWDDFLFDKKFFHRLGSVLPAVLSFFLFVSLVSPDPTVYLVVRKLLLLWICITGAVFLDQLLSNTEKGFLAIMGDRKIPFRSYTQVLKILLFLVAGILIFSVILDQNPLGILTGLGALTAVLLLVFKDSLLGLVASLQLNSNNLVQIGDWIELPGQGIDGEVIDIALSTVKIKSGDNTVYSLPTYDLVSSAFKNWRNVKDAGARRLKIAFPVDALTLAPVRPVLERALRAAGQWKVPEALTDATNLEAFRFWAQDYLDGHADIHPDLPRLVKIADPVGRGLPVEMVFHTKVTGYPDFELLRSRLLCHYLAVLPAFGLRVFQEPVGVLTTSP